MKHPRVFNSKNNLWVRVRYFLYFVNSVFPFLPITRRCRLYATDPRALATLLSLISDTRTPVKVKVLPLHGRGRYSSDILHNLSTGVQLTDSAL